MLTGVMESTGQLAWPLRTGMQDRNSGTQLSGARTSVDGDN